MSVNAAMESYLAAFLKLDFLPALCWLFLVCWFDFELKLEDCAEFVVLLCTVADADFVVSVLSGVASDSWTSSKISYNLST